jgi:hypothetical protein
MKKQFQTYCAFDLFLQTLFRFFFIHRSKDSVRKQIGVAVSDDGAKIILQALLNTFSGKTHQLDC